MQPSHGVSRPSRTKYLAVTLAVGLLLLIGFAMTRQELSTRPVRYNGELCIEYFDLKDGLEVRAECPSRAAEAYRGPVPERHYPPGFPVKRVE